MGICSVYPMYVFGFIVGIVTGMSFCVFFCDEEFKIRLRFLKTQIFD